MMRRRLVFSREIATVHVAAAVFWLGWAMVGLFGDCRPESHDGQCGMAIAFTGIIGLFHAIIVLGGASVFLAIPAHFLSREERPVTIASAAAFVAGIAALDVCVMVGFVIRDANTQYGPIVNGLALTPLTVFLGAPYTYVLLCLAAAWGVWRVGRKGRVHALSVCAASGGAGLVLGYLVSLQWASTAAGRNWMMAGGLWTGIVVGFVFWYMALRPPVAAVGSR